MNQQNPVHRVWPSLELDGSRHIITIVCPETVYYIVVNPPDFTVVKIERQTGDINNTTTV